jgi:ferric-dicitrate binding protein FerR (iron transport regulator)
MNKQPGFAFEANLRRMLAHTNEETQPRPGFAEQLRRQLVTANQVEEPRQSRALWFSLATAAVFIAIVVLGAWIYPLLWFNPGATATATAGQGSVQVTQIKPLFFNLINRTLTVDLQAGDQTQVAAGSSITTGVKSTAEVVLSDGNVMNLYPGSHLQITSLDDANSGRITRARFMFEHGIVSNQFNNMNVTIDTPLATIRILGTSFRVEVASNGQTRLVTYEGVVELEAAGVYVKVAAGNEVTAQSGTPLLVIPEQPPKLHIKQVIPQKNSDGVISALLIAGETDADAVVTISGIGAAVEADGTFSIFFNLAPGQRVVNLTASSPTGKTTTIEVHI